MGTRGDPKQHSSESTKSRRHHNLIFQVILQSYIEHALFSLCHQCPVDPRPETGGCRKLVPKSQPKPWSAICTGPSRIQKTQAPSLENVSTCHAPVQCQHPGFIYFLCCFCFFISGNTVFSLVFFCSYFLFSLFFLSLKSSSSVSWSLNNLLLPFSLASNSFSTFNSLFFILIPFKSSLLRVKLFYKWIFTE